MFRLRAFLRGKPGHTPGAPAVRHSAVCPVRGKCVRRYACGVMPYARLNARMKLLALQYPSRSAISARLSGPFCSSAAARLILVVEINSTKGGNANAYTRL